MQYWKMGLVAIVLLIILSGCSKKPEFKSMTMEQFIRKQENEDQFVLIDVREVSEFKEGRIPGAVLIPLGELKAKDIEYAKDKEIILVCRSGNRSSSAAAFLVDKGFSNVHNLVGGMLAWAGPVEKD